MIVLREIRRCQLPHFTQFFKSKNGAREMQVFNFSAGPSMMPVEVPGLLGAFFSVSFGFSQISYIWRS